MMMQITYFDTERIAPTHKTYHDSHHNFLTMVHNRNNTLFYFAFPSQPLSEFNKLRLEFYTKHRHIDGRRVQSDGFAPAK